MDPITRKSFKKLLFEKVCRPAMLEQFRIDRDKGKVLCPKMDKLVNAYVNILKKYPEPGVAQ